MCGICGMRRIDGPPVDADLVQAMADALRHRGPDDQGVWHSPDGLLGLGHRRLSIIDLSPAGHQPMQDASGHLQISFNGEIYNYQELREELSRAGHSFRAATDTEVILEAYREWGVEPELDIMRNQGFSLPLEQWFRGDWGASMCDVLCSRFDQQSIQSLISGQQLGQVNTHRLFALTIFDLWRREYRPLL